MRICATFLILGVLTACSSTPLELPTCQIPETSLDTQQPLTLPELPVEVSSTESTATFDVAGMQQLKRYRIASEANSAIASANADALAARNESTNALIECSEGQEHWSQIREEMLEQERRDHFIDNWFYRGVIALGLIAVAI